MRIVASASCSQLTGVAPGVGQIYQTNLSLTLFIVCLVSVLANEQMSLKTQVKVGGERVHQ